MGTTAILASGFRAVDVGNAWFCFFVLVGLTITGCLAACVAKDNPLHFVFWFADFVVLCIIFAGNFWIGVLGLLFIVVSLCVLFRADIKDSSKRRKKKPVNRIYHGPTGL